MTSPNVETGAIKRGMIVLNAEQKQKLVKASMIGAPKDVNK